jgi:hypothetical protein
VYCGARTGETCDDERGVEQSGKGVDPRDAGASRARTRQVEAEAIGGGHWWSVSAAPDGYAGASASVQAQADGGTFLLLTRQLDALRYARPETAFQAARSFNVAHLVLQTVLSAVATYWNGFAIAFAIQC